MSGITLPNSTTPNGSQSSSLALTEHPSNTESDPLRIPVQADSSLGGRPVTRIPDSRASDSKEFGSENDSLYTASELEHLLRVLNHRGTLSFALHINSPQQVYIYASPTGGSSAVHAQTQTQAPQNPADANPPPAPAAPEAKRDEPEPANPVAANPPLVPEQSEAKADARCCYLSTMAKTIAVCGIVLAVAASYDPDLAQSCVRSILARLRS